MKRVFCSLVFAFIILIFIPTKIDAVMTNCSMSNNGTQKCNLSQKKNDPDFRYSVSAIYTKGNYIYLEGWAFLKGIDSYGDNKYNMALSIMSNSDKRIGGQYLTNKGAKKNVGNITTSVTVERFDLTCLHLVEENNYTKKARCKTLSKKDDMTLVNTLHKDNKNGKSYKTSLYRQVGFTAKIKYKGSNSIYSYYTKGLACNKTKSDKFSLLLEIQAPLAKSPKTVYQRTIAVYDKIVNTSKNNFTISSDTDVKISVPKDQLDDKFLTRQTVGRVKKTNDLWSTSNYLKDGGKQIYIPPYTVYGNSDRRFDLIKVGNGVSSTNATSGSKIKVHSFKLKGNTKLGQKDSQYGKVDRIIFNNSKGKFQGWISESWTNPSRDKSKFSVTVRKDCEPPDDKPDTTTKRLTCKTTSNAPEECTDDESKYEISKMTSQDASLAGIAGQEGYNVTVSDPEGCRSKYYKRQTISGAGYCRMACNEQTTLYLYGYDNIEGSNIYNVGKQYIYAGQYFKLNMKDKLTPTAVTTQTCVFADEISSTTLGKTGGPTLSSRASTCASAYSNQVKANTEAYIETDFSLKYDRGSGEIVDEIERGELVGTPTSSVTKMSNYNIPYVRKWTTTEKYIDENGEEKTRVKNHTTEHNYSGQMYKVTSVVKKNLTNNNQYYRDINGNIYKEGTDKIPSLKDLSKMELNTYPVELAVTDGKKDITLNISGVKSDGYFNGTKDYTYTCDYDPIAVHKPTTEDPPEDEENPDGVFYFRPVSLEDLFPNDREAPINWLAYPEIIEKIEDDGNSIHGNSYSRNRWEFTMSPTNIRNVKQFNLDREKSGRGYFNKDVTCEVVNGVKSCKSNFIKPNLNYFSSVESDVKD